MSYRLTVGKARDGRDIAVITEGGHPQLDNMRCTVCTIALLDELPNRDADEWFKEQIALRPWESRQ